MFFANVEATGQFQDVREDIRIQPRDSAWLRAMDIVGAAIGLIMLIPLMLFTALIIRIFDSGPVLFRQRRIGAGGQVFECLKFRTMVTDADTRLYDLLLNCPQARAEWDVDHKLRKDPRTTTIGRFLRKSSIDELPQLFNILKGEMSLVGPRPIVAAEIERYGRYFNYYARVRPGLTGLWQVSGRNNVSYRRRIAMDVFYARKRNLRLNLQILARTIPAVLSATGSS